jgi:hypothetical protein
MKILALLTFLLALTGCPDDHKDSHESDTNKVLFVKGDPHALIAGAQANSTSPITVANAREWNSYSLIVLQQFVEKEEVLATQGTDLTKENETKDRTKQETKLTMALELSQAGDGHWLMKLYGGLLTFDMEQTSDGRLQPVQVTTPKDKVAVRAVHWSVTPDHNYMSLLVEGEDNQDGRSLVAMYFEKTAPAQAVPTTDSKYVYSAGPGKKIGWRGKKISVSVCGASKYRENVQEAVALWNKPLTGRMQLELKFPATYAPFSDLNQHCIYAVDSYLTDNRKNVLNYGITLPIRSLSRLEHVDADIFLFESEISKLYTLGYSYRLSNDVRYTIIHELGHVLGLGHKFDGTPSIMSYEYTNREPTAYDIEALGELYK